jgi:hypothetical protein
MQKVLWVVGYPKLDDFIQKATDLGVSDVAIRSDMDIFAAINGFKGTNIRVQAWRWPSAVRVNAMKEAQRVAALFDEGMDGYIVDVEGDPGHPWNWDQPGLEAVATDFCTQVVTAAADRPFGVTSHFRAAQVFPHLPWKQFIDQATVLLPQAYWRVAGGTVAGGDPVKNYKTSINAWNLAGGSVDKIVPMAGELAHATADEVDRYVGAASGANVGRLDFYTHDSNVHDDVWNSIRQA